MPAFADQLDTLYYTASAGYFFDSNIYRLPSSADPLIAIGKPGKSDRIQQLSLGIDVDKKYANQELLFKAKGTNNKYRTFSSLNHNDTAYNAAWNWSPGSKLHGTLSENRTQTLYSFADVRTNVRNLRTVSTPRLSADWWFQSNWHLLLGIGREKSTSSAVTANTLSYRTNTKEWGMKYDPSDGNWVTLMSRRIRGSYQDLGLDVMAQIDTEYTEKQQVIQANWQLTGKSVLSGNLNNIKRQYPVYAQRDYSGMERGIKYSWGVTGKTYFDLALNRSINTWFDKASSYYVTDKISMTPGWQVSPKLNLNLTIFRSKTDYRNPVVVDTVARKDVNQSQELGVGWALDRSLNFNLSLQHSRRTSNYASYEFSDKSANLYLLVTF
jgi:exopolysaccharide biosynthesis operon protein EpsL